MIPGVVVLQSHVGSETSGRAVLAFLEIALRVRTYDCVLGLGVAGPSAKSAQMLSLLYEPTPRTTTKGDDEQF
jgi:hypothetical protein